MNNSSMSCVLLVAFAMMVSCSTSGIPAQKNGALNSTHCSYAGQRSETRRLLHRIDQELPRVVGATERTLQGPEREDMPAITLDSCFVEFSSTAASSVIMFDRSAAIETALRRQLRHSYHKHIGTYNSIEVLEYNTDEAAVASKTLQDSLVAVCRGQNLKLEPCAGVDLYRVTQHKACLVRYNFHNIDPTQLSILHRVGANLRRTL